MAAPATLTLDVLVIGAGVAGIDQLRILNKQGFNVRAIETASDLGGTWYFNRYPGCRCDVASMDYCFRFDPQLQKEFRWSEKYAQQPEILGYLNEVADRYDVRKDIDFNRTAKTLVWDAERGRWVTTTEDGHVYDSQFVVLATGSLSKAKIPDIDGLDQFQGTVLHTTGWPIEQPELEGKRIAVVGTGSSGIQVIPKMAEVASHLTVFQRSANYVFPQRNGQVPEEVRQAHLSDLEGHNAAARASPSNMTPLLVQPPGDHHEEVPFAKMSAEEVEAAYQAAWDFGGFSIFHSIDDLMVSKEADAALRAFFQRKLQGLVADDGVRQLLTPDTRVFCKRLPLSDTYYPTFNRDNVTLVSVKGEEKAIQTLTPTGLRLADGTAYDFDVLVFATGFDALTGAVLALDIRGVDGATVQQAWRDGPHTFLGIMVPGFPNMFTISGPQSPSVLSNSIPTIEQHNQLSLSLLRRALQLDASVVSVPYVSAQLWSKYCNTISGYTLYGDAEYTACTSWYLGANIPGKPRVFLPFIGGYPLYVEQCQRIEENEWMGVAFDGQVSSPFVPSPLPFGDGADGDADAEREEEKGGEEAGAEEPAPTEATQQE